MSQSCVFITGHTVVRIAKKKQYCTEVLQKVQNIWKATKLTENINSRKAIAIH